MSSPPNLQHQGHPPAKTPYHLTTTTTSMTTSTTTTAITTGSASSPSLHPEVPSTATPVRGAAALPPRGGHRLQAGLDRQALSLPQPSERKPVMKHNYTFDVNEKLLLVMVGLPARGKSYTAKKLVGYLDWLGLKVKIFNFDERKRQMMASAQPPTSPQLNPLLPNTTNDNTNTPTTKTTSASNISNEDQPDLTPPPILLVTNPSSQTALPTIQVVTPEDETAAYMMKALLKETFDWFDLEDGEIAIFVPWGTTHNQQRRLVSRCEAHGKHKIDVLFIENICNDSTILAENMKNKIGAMQLKGWTLKDATTFLQSTVLKYQSKFNTIEDDTLSYVKIINLRSKIICNAIYGYLPSVVTNFLMSIHVGVRPIWLLTPAQASPQSPSQDCQSPDTVVFDADGEKFRTCIPLFIDKRIPTQKDSLVVFTSSTPQAIKTVEFLKAARKVDTPVLNPLNTGTCSGMSKTEATEKFPEVWKRYKENPFSYRFPNGESYADMVRRLENFVLQLERFTVPVLVVVHESVVQLLYCYFKNLDVEQAPMLRVPKHTVVELASTRAGWTEKTFQLVKDDSS